MGGLVGINSLWLFLLGYPAMFIGDRLGFALFRRYGGRFYRRVALLALLAIGVTIIARGLSLVL